MMFPVSFVLKHDSAFECCIKSEERTSAELPGLRSLFSGI